MNVNDVFRDLILLQDLMTEEMIKSGKSSVTIDNDKVPYVKFIEFFEHQKHWQVYMKHDTVFMKMIQIESLFFFKVAVMLNGKEIKKNVKYNTLTQHDTSKISDNTNLNKSKEF